MVIFTVFRDNWQPYMKKYTEVFQSQFPNLNTDYLLLDTEQIDFDSYLDADLIIIGGGNTEIYSYLCQSGVQKLYQSYA